MPWPMICRSRWTWPHESGLWNQHRLKSGLSATSCILCLLIIEKGFFERDMCIEFCCHECIYIRILSVSNMDTHSSFVFLFLSCSSIQVYKAKHALRIFFGVLFRQRSLPRWSTQSIHASMYVGEEMCSMYARHDIGFESLCKSSKQSRFTVSCHTPAPSWLNGFPRWCRDALSLKSVHLKSAGLPPIWNQLDLKSVVQSGIWNVVDKCRMAAVCVLLSWSAEF